MDRLLVKLDDQILLGQDGPLGVGGGDMRIAVPIPADPGAEGQEGGKRRGGAGKLFSDLVSHLRVDLRDDPVKGLFKVEEAVLDLFPDRRPLQMNIAGLPEEGDLVEDLVLNRLPLARGPD